MSKDADKNAQNIDAVVDALMDYIDTGSPEEVEAVAVQGGSRASLIASARSTISRIRSEIAAQRRARVTERMNAAARRPTPDVSNLSRAELERIFAEHVANDGGSATMAARHERGEMDEAELRSVVADILRLRDGE